MSKNNAPADAGSTKNAGADPAAAPIRAPKKTEQSLRVNFTEKELLEIGKRLAEANRELEAAEGEKKSITGTLKAKCDSIAARISHHSGELTNGYTYRNVPCEVRFDAPKKGMKQTVRLDSGETIETAAMTLGEMQAELPGIPADPAPPTRPERKPSRTVSASGVVVTDGDGDAFLDDQDTNP
jgi:hypothetical protein